LTAYLDLADHLIIAEAVLDIPAEVIAQWPGIGLAASALHAPAAGYGGIEFYPDVVDKAAVFCVRLARNHPPPDGNKRVAYLALLEFLARNDFDWKPPFGRGNRLDDGGRRRGTDHGERIRELVAADAALACSPTPGCLCQIRP
jgi:death on curing protein